MALNRLERVWKQGDDEQIAPFYVDLIAYRSLSQEIASKTEVSHESPQILVLVNRKCIYHASHFDIRYSDLIQFASNSALN